MSSVVLDTSVIIAYIKSEQGFEPIEGHVRGALLSSVNFAELISVLLRDGKPRHLVRKIVELSGIRVVEFDAELAEVTGILISRTRHKGLSLGDCACLALALRESCPAVTRDRAWRDLDLGIEIRLIR